MPRTPTFSSSATLAGRSANEKLMWLTPVPCVLPIAGWATNSSSTRPHVGGIAAIGDRLAAEVLAVPPDAFQRARCRDVDVVQIGFRGANGGRPPSDQSDGSQEDRNRFRSHMSVLIIAGR